MRSAGEQAAQRNLFRITRFPRLLQGLLRKPASGAVAETSLPAARSTAIRASPTPDPQRGEPVRPCPFVRHPRSAPPPTACQASRAGRAPSPPRPIRWRRFETTTMTSVFGSAASASMAEQRSPSTDGLTQVPPAGADRLGDARAELVEQAADLLHAGARGADDAHRAAAHDVGEAQRRRR